MSDLISISELIKLFKEHMRTARDFREIIINIIPTIKNQPTAYDIDKAVEELEKLQDKAVSIKNEDISMYATGMMGKAIEIIKQGGSSDDVCEWKRDDMLYTVYKICGGCFTSVYQKDFKYCPYCGKKIKVVE